MHSIVLFFSLTMRANASSVTAPTTVGLAYASATATLSPPVVAKPPSAPQVDMTESKLSDKQYSVAAGLANMSTKLLLHPLDTTKARMQAQPFGNLESFRSLWTLRGMLAVRVGNMAHTCFGVPTSLRVVWRFVVGS